MGRRGFTFMELFVVIAIIAGWLNNTSAFRSLLMICSGVCRLLGITNSPFP